MPRPLTFAEFFVGRDAPMVYGVLWAAVGFVLLIACANLANLLLARTLGRTRETAVRVALGAGRWRIIQPLIVESLAISALGGAAGWWIASLGLRLYALSANPPARAWSDHLLDFGMDGRVFAYLLTISVVAALAFGLAPIAHLMRLDINGTLKDGGRTGSSTHSRQLSEWLVVGEMALAVVLLAGAGVMVRSFLSMATADLGIRSPGVASMLLRLPLDRYPTDMAQRAFFDRLKARLDVLPAVDSVSIASELPAASVARLPYELAGSAPVDERQRPTVSLLTIGPRYFNTLEATILSGRDFNDFDQASGAPVAIVNEAFARASWPGEEAVGKRLRMFDEGGATAWVTVVGVASHITQNTTDWQAHDAVVYRPFRQRPGRSMWVLVRTRWIGGAICRPPPTRSPRAR